MFAHLTLRVMGAGGFGVLGWRLGGIVSKMSSDEERFLPWGLALTLAGVPVGAFLAPYLTIKPWRKSTDYINSIAVPTLAAGTLGLLVGMIIASLISIPLCTLDGWLGWAVPGLVSLPMGIAAVGGGGAGGVCEKAMVYGSRTPRRKVMGAIFPTTFTRASSTRMCTPRPPTTVTQYHASD